MAAVILEIADEMVSIVNAASLSLPFTAERVYLPRHTLLELEDLTVSVVPRLNLFKAGARRHPTKDISVDIGVEQKTDGSLSEIDPLLLLVEELHDLFFHRRLDTPAGVVWQEITNEPLYSPERLDEERVFMSVITVTYNRTV